MDPKYMSAIHETVAQQKDLSNKEIKLLKKEYIKIMPSNCLNKPREKPRSEY